MRNPSDEARAPTIAAEGAADGPVRRCVLSGDREPRGELIRLALGPDGRVHPDVRTRAPGRGAWIGVPRSELEAALATRKLRGALSRAFKGPVEVDADLPERIADALRRHALDRLGLEARSGHLLTGSDKIDKAARLGRLRALYHAADASGDGARKLAQAWRVGSDREGSDLKGVVLPLPRAILSLALGRENVVHIGLTDQAAAKRVGEALGRWLRFIGPDPDPGSRRGIASPGPDPDPASCGTAPREASALPDPGAPTAALN